MKPFEHAQMAIFSRRFACDDTFAEINSKVKDPSEGWKLVKLCRSFHDVAPKYRQISATVHE
ncbi:MAG: hypothetical protein KGL39_46625 [Patescibacteria group bacterium]|nr:hypothetical protein [Patescibacteria group bacterium]